MLKSYTVLKAYCDICTKRADYRLEVTNDDLPKNFLNSGTRLLHYCAKHVPVFIMKDIANWKKEISLPPGS